MPKLPAFPRSRDAMTKNQPPSAPDPEKAGGMQTSLSETHQTAGLALLNADNRPPMAWSSHPGAIKPLSRLG